MELHKSLEQEDPNHLKREWEKGIDVAKAFETHNDKLMRMLSELGTL